MGFKSFTDFTGFKNVEVLFNGPPSDIVVKSSNKLNVIELPVAKKGTL